MQMLRAGLFSELSFPFIEEVAERLCAFTNIRVLNKCYANFPILKSEILDLSHRSYFIKKSLVITGDLEAWTHAWIWYSDRLHCLLLLNVRQFPTTVKCCYVKEPWFLGLLNREQNLQHQWHANQQLIRLSPVVKAPSSPSYHADPLRSRLLGGSINLQSRQFDWNCTSFQSNLIQKIASINI